MECGWQVCPYNGEAKRLTNNEVFYKSIIESRITFDGFCEVCNCIVTIEKDIFELLPRDQGKDLSLN